jgi:hypothetical protein
MALQIAHGGAEFPTSVRGPAMFVLEGVLLCQGNGKAVSVQNLG